MFINITNRRYKEKLHKAQY